MKKNLLILLFCAISVCTKAQFNKFTTLWTCDFDHVTSSSTPGDPWRGTALELATEGTSPDMFYNDFGLFSLPSDYLKTTIMGYGIMNEIPQIPGDNATGSGYHYLSNIYDHTSGKGNMLVCKNYCMALAVSDYNLKKGDCVRFSVFVNRLIKSTSSIDDKEIGVLWGQWMRISTQRHDYFKDAVDQFTNSGFGEITEQTGAWTNCQLDYTLEEDNPDSVFIYIISPVDTSTGVGYTANVFDDLSVSYSHRDISINKPLNSNFELVKNINFDSISAVNSTNLYSRGVEMDKTAEGYSTDNFSNTYSAGSYSIQNNTQSATNKDHTFEDLRSYGYAAAQDTGFYFYGNNYNVDITTAAKANDAVYVKFYASAIKSSTFNITLKDNSGKEIYNGQQTLSSWGWQAYSFSLVLPTSVDAKSLTLSITNDSGSQPFALDDISMFVADQTNALYTIIVEPNDTTLGSIEGPNYRYFDGTANATFTAMPNANADFLRWSDGETAVSRTIRTDKDCKLIAFFSQKNSTGLIVAVLSDDTTMGTVKTNQDSYTLLDKCTITATAKTGYQFVKWSDGETAYKRTMIVAKDTFLIAYFEPIPNRTVKFRFHTPIKCSLYAYDYDYPKTTTHVNKYFNNGDTVAFSQSTGDNLYFRINISDSKNYRLKFNQGGWEICSKSSSNSGDFVVKRDSTIDVYIEETPTYKVHLVSTDTAKGYCRIKDEISNTWDTVGTVSIYDTLGTVTISQSPKTGCMFLGYINPQTKEISTRLFVQSDTTVLCQFVTCASDSTYISLTVNDSTMGTAMVVCKDTFYSDYNGSIRGYSADLIAQSKPGYYFCYWKSFNQISSYKASQSTSFSTGYAYVYEAVFAKVRDFNITATTDTVMGTVKGGGSYPANKTVTLTAVAKDGYYFCYWQNEDGTQYQDSRYTITVNCDAAYTAIFRKMAYTKVTVLCNDSTLGYVTGSGSYRQGLIYTIKAVPNIGVRFVGWSNTGKTNDISTSYTAADTDEEVTYVAYFEPDTDSVSNYRHFVAIPNDTAMGYVHVQTNSDPDNIYKIGTYITISYKAFQGYKFVQWSNGSYDDPVKLNVTEDDTLIAYFTPLLNTLTLKADNNGSVTGGGQYYTGDVEIQAIPDKGYAFDHWSDNDTNAVRIIHLDSDLSLVAYFKEDSTPTKCLNINAEDRQNEIVNVYNTLGCCLKRNVRRKDATEDLPIGIYIIGDEKFLKTER